MSDSYGTEFTPTAAFDALKVSGGLAGLVTFVRKAIARLVEDGWASVEDLWTTDSGHEFIITPAPDGSDNVIVDACEPEDGGA